MALKTLEDLFVHFLRDIYYAEKQILKTLPKMARKAESEQLRDAFEHHREETESQIENLEKVFEMLELKARGVTCEAINGIIEEGKDIMSEAESPDVRDAGMIAGAQAVEHYEITRYGTLIAWGEQLGKKDAVKLLKENLEQEVSALNREAA
jgi:ferritin-like metal-binding protein YciE